MSVYVMVPAGPAASPPPTDPGLTWVGLAGHAATGPAFDWDGTGTPPVTPLTGQQAMLAADASTSGYTGVDALVLDYNRQVLRQRAQQALAANQAYLAIGSPNLAQATQQINVLTRECSALIRTTLDVVDSLAGT